MAIQFHNLTHEFVYQRVRGFLEASEIPFSELGDNAAFQVRGESAAVQIWVIGSQIDALVRVVSWVVLGAKSSDPELMRSLLHKNAELPFGAFGVDADGDICLSHAFIGTSCEQAQLLASLRAVLSAADSVDDEVVARWGGQRPTDPS